MSQNHILGVDLEIWFALATAVFVILVFALRVIIGIFRGENVLDVLEKSLDDAVDFDSVSYTHLTLPTIYSV